MISIKTPEEINIMREGGHILAGILAALSEKVRPGTTTLEIDQWTNELCKKANAVPVFLNYRPQGAPRPYPASICVSVNDEIVHGIPNEIPKTLVEGDIVSLDMGIRYKKLVVDSAVTIGVGQIDKAALKLLRTTREALYVGITAAKAGVKTGDVGYAIEQFVRPFKFGICEELGGHGVGHAVHEDPFVPNFGKRGQGVVLRPGMTIAIEPMLNEGSKRVVLDADGYTFRTADGSRSAHFEHTIAITESGEPQILTELR
jgi:methionyl aminopeptidase